MATACLGIAHMRFHEDRRRAFYGDIFETHDGDVNVVYVQEDIPIAWHRHQKQDDHLFLVSGALLIKVRLTNTSCYTVELTESNRGPVPILGQFWHGYEALVPNTVVLQFNGPGKWDGTDEERHPIDDEMPWT